MYEPCPSSDHFAAPFFLSFLYKVNMMQSACRLYMLRQRDLLLLLCTRPEMPNTYFWCIKLLILFTFNLHILQPIETEVTWRAF
jgi:hypothetical protein